VASGIDQQRAGPSVPPPAGAAERAQRRRRLLQRFHPWALVELFVLTGFAIAQPLLDVTGKSPELFVFSRAGRGDILLMVLGVTLLPALGVWAGEVLIGLVSEPLRRLAHLAAVTGLLTVIAIQVIKKLTEARGPVLMLLAAAVGLLAGALYARQAWVKLWLRYLAPAPLVFALLFVLVSPSSRLVLPARAAPAGGAAAVAPGERPPVVFIFFDEFPLKALLDSKGRVDRRVYPNFAEFAERSTWYRNTTGVSGFTPWAMPAMLTGRYPSRIAAPIYYEYPDNLFTLFSRRYHLKVYETISQLCPPTLCEQAAGGAERTGLPGVLWESAKAYRDIVSPYDAAVDPASLVSQTANQDAAAQDGKPLDPKFRFNQLRLNQPSRFTDFVNGLKRSDTPTMHFLHLLLPHAPWRYLPSGVEYNFKTFGRGFKSPQTPAQIRELAHERMLLQLAYTDRLIGQVIQRLKAQGMWDKALVVLTADHGNGWTPGEKPRSLMVRNTPDLMWVPLFVKAPGQDEGRIDDRNFEQVDLLPTMADLLGVKVPWKMDGLSQTGPPARKRGEKWWFDIPGHREVRDGPSNFSIVLQGETDTLVRASEGVKGLYRFGAFADLVYQDPASVGPIGGDGASAEMDDWKRYRSIDPASGELPALVSGTLTSPAPPPAGGSVLVAVNGKIAGESKLFQDRPGDPAGKFAVIAPDFLFKAGDGRRQLQVYLVDRSGGGPRLSPVALSGA
jgi:Sulfatase